MIQGLYMPSISGRREFVTTVAIWVDRPQRIMGVESVMVEKLDIFYEQRKEKRFGGMMILSAPLLGK